MLSIWNLFMSILLTVADKTTVVNCIRYVHVFVKTIYILWDRVTMIAIGILLVKMYNGVCILVIQTKNWKGWGNGYFSCSPWPRKGRALNAPVLVVAS